MPPSGPAADRQFAALPFRKTTRGIEVLLIISRETHRWELPKGWAEEGLSGAELARKEAFEEAGIVGWVSPAAVGTYRYLKRMADGEQRQCEVTVFPMTVEAELDDWPERGERQRQWFEIERAATLVEEAELANLLRQSLHLG